MINSNRDGIRLSLSSMVLIAVACAASITSGAETFVDTWEDGSTSCWAGDSIWTEVVVEPMNGAPGGWLRSYSVPGHSGYAGITTTKPEACGNWVTAQAVLISVDARIVAGTPITAGFRVRRGPDVNGWFYTLAPGSLDASWQTISVAIDPSWTDAEAEAAGWSKEGDTDPSWTETLGHHAQLSFRAFSSGPIEMGYDNFQVIFDGPVCPADSNIDGVVDVEDLLFMLGAWNFCDCCWQDVNRDRTVDINDLLALLGAWGDCPMP